MLAVGCSGGTAGSASALQASCAGFGKHPRVSAVRLAAAPRTQPALRDAAGAYLATVAARDLVAELERTQQGDSGGYAMRRVQNLMAANRRVTAAAVRVRAACEARA